ncbi:MAG TPA: site-specific DNA-methyltransferase [Candidatus Woesebacteria bacterium]|nr:site-specific DNA-methyltransferase [Candidatus Woesebacteria bacterium]
MSIKPGDLFALGQHRLICGDATDAHTVKKLVGEQLIDVVLTDVPYGVGYVESKQDFTQSVAKQKIIANDQFQTNTQYQQFMQAWIRAVEPHLASKNAFYVFNSDRMLFALEDAFAAEDVRFAQLLIWIKNSAVVGRLDYLPQHELIAYGWHGRHKFVKSKDKSVLFYPKPNKSVLHPTMKPIGLLRRLILNSSNRGEIVYDCFGGSGSTLIACEQTKRRCLMVELDPEYCQTSIDRWQKLTSEKARQI